MATNSRVAVRRVEGDAKLQMMLTFAGGSKQELGVKGVLVYLKTGRRLVSGQWTRIRNVHESTRRGVLSCVSEFVPFGVQPIFQKVRG